MSSKTADQLFRALVVVSVLLLTPVVVFHYLVPLVFAHPLGIVVALVLLTMIGAGLYIIAEDAIPSVLRAG